MILFVLSFGKQPFNVKNHYKDICFRSDSLQMYHFIIVIGQDYSTKIFIFVHRNTLNIK